MQEIFSNSFLHQVFIKFPKKIFFLILENVNMEYFASVVLNMLTVIFISLMFFGLLCALMLLTKTCWIIFNALCYWFFGRDTIKELLNTAKKEERDLLHSIHSDVRAILDKLNNH